MIQSPHKARQRALAPLASRRLPTSLATASALAVAAMLGLMPFNPALAIGQNQDQPIHIAADQAELDDAQGRATYVGDVVVTQGLTRLQADKVVVHRNDQGITKIVATGNQAHYSDQESEAAPKTEAYADTIIYTQADEILQLVRRARLEQNQNSFQGDLIRYDTQNRRVTASADKNGGSSGRVEMVIQPRAKGASSSASGASPSTSGAGQPSGANAPKEATSPQ